MGEKPQKIQEQKHISLGVLAHVDAGKTTLSEGLLFKCGRIRKIGRVDHKDAYLDTYELERERGITIFSKQAVFSMGDMEVTLLDTPGHVDFSAEMERTLQVLDYAILVINGADGVQGHTQTLWRLLNQYQIPTFLFVNKMDQDGTNRESLLEELKKKLSENCVDFRGELDCCGAEEDSDIKGTVDKAGEVHGTDEFLENIAVCEEALMEQFLDTGIIVKKDVARLILERKLFPCFFGSALKMEGVDAFIRGMETYMAAPVYPSEFGAKVFKIARDDQGNRLTYMKITGGSLKVKETLTNAGRKGIPDEEIWEEKVDQIRIYSGAKFEMLKEAEAGTVCAVTGFTETYPGEGLGVERESVMPVLEPVLNYQIILPEGYDAHKMLKSLKELEEEEPQLHIMWDEQLGEIHAMLMGEVQIEILKHLIWERFHVAVEFGTGNIVYKETIAAPVEGVGHFEPLRHYAEVHLLLEPGERGSGLQFFTAASEDQLDLAAPDPHSSGRERTSGCTYRIADHRYADHSSYRPGTPEAYGGRRFPSGNLPCSASGPQKSENRPSGAILQFPAGTSGRKCRPCHDRYPADAGKLPGTGNRGRAGCDHRQRAGCKNAGLPEPSDFLHKRKRPSQLYIEGV